MELKLIPLVPVKMLSLRLRETRNLIALAYRRLRWLLWGRMEPLIHIETIPLRSSDLFSGQDFWDWCQESFPGNEDCQQTIFRKVDPLTGLRIGLLLLEKLADIPDNDRMIRVVLYRYPLHEAIDNLLSTYSASGNVQIDKKKVLASLLSIEWYETRRYLQSRLKSQPDDVQNAFLPLIPEGLIPPKLPNRELPKVKSTNPADSISNENRTVQNKPKL
ncbi:hypothetical protein SAMN05444156_2456 [Verrucomicrobium sp. GAS474]|uniref:hypothetical protein n=1 Tax=Verrucomicrobium sp. GAS474 TaxID=1882831 RepID=UPI00087D7601|nr:hypothetical protein [Verrucomicrobium sp. GAS474]SDU18225.1 hypothetical protein SAMN05444156_2456 [Verrucomicrobium sp. GAS474]